MGTQVFAFNQVPHFHPKAHMNIFSTASAVYNTRGDTESDTGSPDLGISDDGASNFSLHTVDGFVLVPSQNRKAGELIDLDGSLRDAETNLAEGYQIVALDIEDYVDNVFQEHKELMNDARLLLAELEAQQADLKVVQTAYLDLTECPICLDNMSRPFTLGECGHIFCARCLHEHFRVSLERRLADPDTPFLSDGTGIPYSLCEAPLDMTQQNALITSIEEDGKNPRDFFKYECPSCRHIVTAPPVEIKQVTVFLEKVKSAISRQFPADAYHEIDSDGTSVKEYGFEHFTPLFMNN